MDSWEDPVLGCDTLSTTAPEARWNPEMSTPILKQETYPYEPLESSQYVNYYDSNGLVLEKLKKEFPEDEYPQSDFNIHYTIVSENKELFQLIDAQGVNHENAEDGLSFIKNYENVNKNYQVIVKMERLEEPDILYNTEATSIHYDVLVTPQEVQCKLCGRIFKNSFSLLKHNSEHIKVEIKTRADNELHQCQCCDKRFNSHDNVLLHVDIVHNKKIPKSKLCEKQCKSTPNVKRNVVPLPKQMSPNQVSQYSLKCRYCNEEFKNRYVLYKHMKPCRTGKVDEEMKYKCDSCERVYMKKYSLKLHIEKTHYDYGRTFECWCGKQYRSPIQLHQHNTSKHGKNEVYKCNYCNAVYNVRSSLSYHIRDVHYDYGRTFECWCGKQFRTPGHLSKHKSRQHDDKMNDSNDVKFQCKTCQKNFKTEYYLQLHIKESHYDYDKLFNCHCGKQFRTPARLSQHKRRQHGKNPRYSNNNKVQCDYCQRKYKRKQDLITHIQNIHNDYGEVFKCWCGKQFHSPIYLHNHKRLVHNNQMTVECDYCQKKFKNKYNLLGHIKMVHYDYGNKVFACWCGKQFRTPLHLCKHKRQHCVKSTQIS